MPRNKNGHNQNHNVKQQNNHTHGRTFTDNRDQQERLAKFLEQKENKKNREENRLLVAQRQLEQREQQEQQRQAQLNAQIQAIIREWDRERERHLFAPHFIRHRGQQNQPFVERQEPANEDNHFNTGRQCPRVFR